ncbi:MAG TPA: SpoIID/LytB domain-containing protein [Gaiellaceae bacterium]|nr:SpoIID/LytB domain-containing protein [Gaiellaceae bacterium]
MRLVSRFTVSGIAVLVALVLAATAQPAVTFVLKGRGWGHGIGLGQYGAHGLAQNGRTYSQILAHYYQGTAQANRSATIRVLLVAGNGSLQLGSDANFNGGGGAFSAGTWVVSAGAAGKIKLVKGPTTRTVADPTTFTRGTASLEIGGVKYRGSITIRRSGSTVWALNTLGLNDYVKGVVPREMPSSWHAEALKAQAVAARSYALAAGGHCSWFGTSVMCRDTRDQVYGGQGGEAASTNAAVDATSGKVLVSGGAVATTFFFSTSGGRTAAKHHEWGGSPISYLTSVNDPFDNISPHHIWGPLDSELDCPPTPGRDCVWSGSGMKSTLGTRAPNGLTDMTVTRNASLRVANVTATGASGTTSISGATMRSVLGLRSTWFTIGVMRITGGGTINKGQTKVLPALARNLSGVHLQRRRLNESTWTTLREISGNVNIQARPAVTTLYRLSSASGATAAVRVNVRPSVQFSAEYTSRSLSGSAGGELAGEVVQVQRQTLGGAWQTVATAVVREDGTWSADLALVPGVYRAYASPGGGIAGMSSTLSVVSG